MRRREKSLPLRLGKAEKFRHISCLKAHPRLLRERADPQQAHSKKVFPPAMKPSLVLKMGQQLTMTPQLQQAIRLLQLSTLDLQQEIQEALDSNPMLVRQEEGEDFDTSDPLADNAELQPTPAQEFTSGESYEEHANLESLAEGGWNERIPNELPVDTAWEDVYQANTSNLPASDDDDWDFTSRTSDGESLQTHLLWQLNLLPGLSDTDKLIAVTLVDALNEQGYLE